MYLSVQLYRKYKTVPPCVATPTIAKEKMSNSWSYLDVLTETVYAREGKFAQRISQRIARLSCINVEVDV